MTDPNSDGETLFERVAMTFELSPREVVVDRAVESIDVAPADGAGRGTVVLVLASSQAVVCHSVWPDPVPDARRQAMSEYVTRANTGLSTAKLELDLDNGVLSVGAGLLVDSMSLVDELSPAGFGRLLWLTLLEVEEQATRHAPGVDAVLAGAAPRGALAALDAVVGPASG